MSRIIFESGSLPGDPRLRTEQWIEALSSGYVRLGAEPAPDLPFEGRLKVIRLDNAAIGTLDGTVRNISRTLTDVTIENTDNVVLLLNEHPHTIAIEQKGKTAECREGGAVLIEQCEPSIIKVSASNVCKIAAIQVPRDLVRQSHPRLTDRFLSPIATPSSALALMRAYINFLLDLPTIDSDALQGKPLTSTHIITDLVAAILGSDGAHDHQGLRGLRAGRLAVILSELDRHFADTNYSLPALARRLGVTPRYIQALLAEADTSFIDELVNRRLDKARDLLTSPHHLHDTILNVGHACGFSSVSHFHRMFRRRFGLTPGEMRATVVQ